MSTPDGSPEAPDLSPEEENALFSAYMSAHFPGTTSGTVAEPSPGAPETIGTAGAVQDPVEAQEDAQEHARVAAYLRHHRLTGS